MQTTALVCRLHCRKMEEVAMCHPRWRINGRDQIRANLTFTRWPWRLVQHLFHHSDDDDDSSVFPELPSENQNKYKEKPLKWSCRLTSGIPSCFWAVAPPFPARWSSCRAGLPCFIVYVGVNAGRATLPAGLSAVVLEQPVGTRSETSHDWLKRSQGRF